MRFERLGKQAFPLGCSRGGDETILERQSQSDNFSWASFLFWSEDIIRLSHPFVRTDGDQYQSLSDILQRPKFNLLAR
jgi:hypothetical protein